MDIRLQVGSKTAYIDGQMITLTEPPVVTNGTLMAPVRVLAEALGLHVSWEDATQTATVSSTVPVAAAAATVAAAGVAAASDAVVIPDWHQVPDPTVAPWSIWEAPITSTTANRDPRLLEAVIKQCGVATSPRYRANQQGYGETYCNIFLWDVTRALGCEIPHWISRTDQKSPAAPGSNAFETDANTVCDWLANHGPDFGWSKADAAAALTNAKAGKPAAVVWKNPGGIGHVAVVCPGEANPAKGVPIAQAGATNFDDGFLTDGFGQSRTSLVTYYIHA